MAPEVVPTAQEVVPWVRSWWKSWWRHARVSWTTHGAMAMRWGTRRVGAQPARVEPRWPRHEMEIQWERQHQSLGAPQGWEGQMAWMAVQMVWAMLQALGGLQVLVRPQVVMHQVVGPLALAACWDLAVALMGPGVPLLVEEDQMDLVVVDLVLEALVRLRLWGRVGTQRVPLVDLIRGRSGLVGQAMGWWVLAGH